MDNSFSLHSDVFPFSFHNSDSCFEDIKEKKY